MECAYQFNDGQVSTTHIAHSTLGSPKYGISNRDSVFFFFFSSSFHLIFQYHSAGVELLNNGGAKQRELLECNHRGILIDLNSSDIGMLESNLDYCKMYSCELVY